MYQKTLVVRCASDLYETVGAVAKEYEITKSDVVRNILKLYEKKLKDYLPEEEQP